MAKIIRGPMIRLITDPRKFDKYNRTEYEVRGDSPYIYTVTVDSEGLWTCSCPSSMYRGLCYHVQMIRVELERYNLLNRIRRVKPVPIESLDFSRYYSQDRFIAEPIYGGPRQFVLFGRRVYLGKVAKPYWHLPEHLKLAGTVLEGTWDNYGKREKQGIFRVIDCLHYKGIDYTLSPLAIRREMVDRVLEKWCPSNVAMTEYEFTPEGKEELMAKYGCCILKDVNSTYDLVNRSPRAWMVKGGRSISGKTIKTR